MVRLSGRLNRFPPTSHSNSSSSVCVRVFILRYGLDLNCLPVGCVSYRSGALTSAYHFCFLPISPNKKFRNEWLYGFEACLMIILLLDNLHLKSISPMWVRMCVLGAHLCLYMLLVRLFPGLRHHFDRDIVSFELNFNSRWFGTQRHGFIILSIFTTALFTFTKWSYSTWS